MTNEKENTVKDGGERQYSDNPSAVSHLAATTQYKNAGLKQKKVYLGNDALAKLTLIYKMQYGKQLDINRIDPILLGDLLSYCINACYNLPSIQRKLPPNSPPQIAAAKTPSGQHLYRYYQMALGTEERQDALELEEIFNSCNKRGKPFFPHIRRNQKNFLLPEMVQKFGDNYKINQDTYTWTTWEIQHLRSDEFVDVQIFKWNKSMTLTGSKKERNNKNSKKRLVSSKSKR
ncbi:hypothetical protein WCT65_01930 [Pectobacterium carotovorum]|uniref:hypothetical protein n=1 Tax=Pectobacterium carotovorum TaxID=554 RepID=UPI001CF2272D|nr:hypothetical protein [Pectobacterium carotovorum]MCA6969757.1 hypothetical protein [Pectobacterium carotovorum]MCH4996804.1 hypothetical protein [Pectobacterium carotovorum]